MYRIRLLIPILMLVFLGACQVKKEAVQVDQSSVLNPLKGTWKMKSIHWKTKDTTYSIQEAQPGLFIFTDKTYSIMWTPTEVPREAFVDLSKPTEEELMSGFKTVVFNAGSYTHTDSTAIAIPIIAKVPGFEGGKQFYHYMIEGDILHLTMFDETYPNGDKPGWYGRYVTEFVMRRME